MCGLVLSLINLHHLTEQGQGLQAGSVAEKQPAELLAE